MFEADAGGQVAFAVARKHWKLLQEVWLLRAAMHWQKTSWVPACVCVFVLTNWCVATTVEEGEEGREGPHLICKLHGLLHHLQDLCQLQAENGTRLGPNEHNEAQIVDAYHRGTPAFALPSASPCLGAACLN